MMHKSNSKDPHNVEEKLESALAGLSLKEESREENSSVNEDSYGNETFSSSSSNGDRVLSSPPSEYDERNRIFHLNFIRRIVVKEVSPMPKKYKNGTRASLSFSNDQMREIERSNRILLSKILSQQPSTYIPGVKRNEQSSAQPIKENAKRISSATVNRRRKQVEIDAHNQLLKRKIEKIARRKSTN